MIFAFSAFLFFLLIGTPIVFVLGIAAALTLIFVEPQIPLTIISQRIFDSLNSFTMMAIPFFVFLGVIMDEGGISRRIVEFAAALVGWIVGSRNRPANHQMGGAFIDGFGRAHHAFLIAFIAP